MMNEKLLICVFEFNCMQLLNRTLSSIDNQTVKAFSCEIIDGCEFWKSNRNQIGRDAEYVFFLCAGSVLTENAVEEIMKTIEKYAPSWLYFDEKDYRAEIMNDPEGIFEKPDFDALAFAQHIYTGEGVVFSKEILNRMQLEYSGSSFSVAMMEMAVQAAMHSEPLHLDECLLIRHRKPEMTEDEKNTLSQVLETYLKIQDFDFLKICRGNLTPFNLLPYKNDEKKLSILVLCEDEKDGCMNFSGFEAYGEIIMLAGSMTYQKKCMLGAQKAKYDVLCFVDSRCRVKGGHVFNTLLYYASKETVGFVSPRIQGQDKCIYGGVFAQASEPLTLYRSDSVRKDLDSVRETMKPAWQLWMVKKTLLNQVLYDESMMEQLSKSNFMQLLAFRIQNLNKKNLYVGYEWAYYREMDEINRAGFVEMLVQYGKAYFLDPYSPMSIRRYMRKNVLKDVKVYFPEKIPNYRKDQKKILVLSHELSLTGAPIVLSHAVRILRKHYQIIVASPVDGVLREAFLKENVPVLILGDMEQNMDWMHWINEFDLVLVNTIVPFKVVERLGESNTPVMWWLHDAKSGYRDFLKNVLPETLPDNVHIYSVSKYADDAVKQYRPKYTSDLLFYGLKDVAGELESAVCQDIASKGKKVFVTVGTVIPRKGQDILVKAIRLLPASIREKCIFLFVGKCIDHGIFQQIKKLEMDYPNEVRQIDAIPHDEIFDLYRQAAAVICSSRDDPLPTFMAETMMVSGVCICSENTGTASVIKNGENGFLYQDDDPEQLAQCICKVTCISEKEIADLKVQSRNTFEQYFSIKIFAENLLKSVEFCMDN